MQALHPLPGHKGSSDDSLNTSTSFILRIYKSPGTLSQMPDGSTDGRFEKPSLQTCVDREHKGTEPQGQVVEGGEGSLGIRGARKRWHGGGGGGASRPREVLKKPVKGKSGTVAGVLKESGEVSGTEDPRGPGTLNRRHGLRGSRRLGRGGAEVRKRFGT